MSDDTATLDPGPIDPLDRIMQHLGNRRTSGDRFIIGVLNDMMDGHDCSPAQTPRSAWCSKCYGMDNGAGESRNHYIRALDLAIKYLTEVTGI